MPAVAADEAEAAEQEMKQEENQAEEVLHQPHLHGKESRKQKRGGISNGLADYVDSEFDFRMNIR